MSIDKVVVKNAVKASDINKIIPDVVEKTANYTVLDDDDFTHILCNIASTGTLTITLPTAADNENRTITFINTAASGGKVLIDGEGAETINGLSSLGMWNQYEKATVLCNGTEWYQISPAEWHLVSDPTTGTLTATSVVGSADSFTGGVTLPFDSQVPLGALAVRARVRAASGTSVYTLYHRKEGDNNVSNAPNAATDVSHLFGINAGGNIEYVPVLWLSSSYKVEIAASTTAGNITVSYPIEWYR